MPRFLLPLMLLRFVAGEWERPYFFVLMADPQVGWNRDGYNSELLFEKAALKVRDVVRPDFVIIAGDLVQNPGSIEQMTTSKSIADSMGCPYRVISGNHDVHSDVSVNRLNEFVEFWGSPGPWYEFDKYGTTYVMIEATVLLSRHDPDASQEVRALAEEEMMWLDSVLSDAAAKSRRVVPVQHYPLATKRMDEEDDLTRNMPSAVRKELADLYRERGITALYAGHYHKNARVTAGGGEGGNSVRGVGGLDVVTYASTGVILGSGSHEDRDPSGFAIIKVYPDRIEERYYGYDDLPAIVESDDPGFTVTHPDGGEVFEAGSTVSIGWESTSMARDVRLEYRLRCLDDGMKDNIDDNVGWETIAESTPNVGSYNWTVPRTACHASFAVRVSSYLDHSISDTSDGTSVIVGSSRKRKRKQKPRRRKKDVRGGGTMP